MLLTINSALTPPSYPGERLSQEVIEYIGDELIKHFRIESEKHALHNKLELYVTFEGGRYKTIVHCRVVVVYRDLAGYHELKTTFEITETAVPAPQWFSAQVMNVIQEGLVAERAKFNEVLDKILDTFKK